MDAWVIIRLVICFAFGMCLSIIAQRRKQSKLFKPKNVYVNDMQTTVFIFDDGATKNNGRVWKCDHTGTWFSSTGFDGPYTKIEAPYVHRG